MEIPTIFFQDGHQLARQYLQDKTGKKELYPAIIRLVNAAYEVMDGLLESFINRCLSEGLKVDCREGCAYCCSQAVLASTHEVLLIKDFMDANFTREARSGIQKRAGDKNAKTSRMTAMEFLHHNHPCPFLEDGNCMIHVVRPMACRCYLSSSLKTCQDQYDDPENRSRVAALYDFPLKAGRGMNEGIRSGLLEKGLVPVEWLLEAFIHEMFEDETIFDAWLEGHGDFNIRELTPEERTYLRDYS
jgi:Fe-S-cluster containining protein